MSSFTVASGKCVLYDGRLKYGGNGTTFTVEDTYENYIKSLVDITAGNITMVSNFTNVVNNEETYLTKTVDFSTAANSSIGTHELFAVTGNVRMKLLAQCTETLVNASGAAVIALGTDASTSAFIGGTSVGLINSGEVWGSSSPATKQGAYGTVVLDKVVLGGLDVGYEVAGSSVSAGIVIFHCWAMPLDATGAVATSNLSAMS